MKVALVKQEVYADLYVCESGLTPKETLFSSSGRVGPIGLFTLLDADFFIVKEEFTPECQIWKKVIPGSEEMNRQLKHKAFNEIEGQEFRRPGSNKPNGYYAINCYSVEWSKYDVVISINCAIPTSIVQQYPNILWAYMIGEANIMSDKVYFGYDICLNQEISGIAYDRVGVIDFPYTFLGANCLEEIMIEHLGRTSLKSGIYAEVNMCQERPVIGVPQLEEVREATDHDIRFHKQLITENLQEVYDAKYFVKIGGRRIRGNSVIEAISLGTPVLMSPVDLGCSQVLPQEAWVASNEEAIEKIRFYDQYPEEYQKLLDTERFLVNQFVKDYPLYALKLQLTKKRENPIPKKAESLQWAIMKSKVKFMLNGV